MVLTWWVFVPAFMLTEALIFHIEIRQEAHSFSLSELPLVIGFFFASPLALVVGRLLGHLIYLVLVRRQALLKLLFNLSSFAAETSVAILVFRSLSAGDGPTHPQAWLAIFVAVLVADGLGMVAVTAAIRWHGGRSRMSSVLTTGGFTAVVNTSLSILAAVILWVSPWAMLLFALVAVIVALAYRGYAGLNQRFSSLQLLYDFTRMVGASIRAEAVMDQVLAEARKLLRAAVAEVILVDEQTAQPMHRLSSPGTGTASQTSTYPPPMGLEAEWVWQEVVNNRRPVVIPRGSRNDNFVSFLSAIGVRDAIVAPLLSEGQVAGAMLVADRLSDVSTFDGSDLQLFATLANHASVAFENGRLVEQLRREANDRRYEALHDSLTGLANRSLFLQQVATLHSLLPEQRGQSAIMLMDLDRFKEVNDTLGHHNGDLLLREVASRLLATLRREDTVARLGGDEFAVLLPALPSVDEAIAAAERVVDELSRPFRLEELSVDVGVSIGIAISPDHGHDPTTLLQRADVAMYEAKAADKAVSLYSPDRDNYSPSRLTMVAELREAIAAGELLVYHQPKARLEDGRVTGTEALVRWRHPDRGLIGPDEFIPMAEQTGLIVPLTSFMIEESLKHCRRWRADGYDLGVSVNLAVRSLLDTDLPLWVSDMLAQVDVPGECLTLEITESGVMADPSRTISVLERLAAIGVKLSVDDFGTGYSSLSYLRRLPVHEVKVDRSFVFSMISDPGDATIVQSIIELGRNLGLRTVAEGVEDQLCWDHLRAIGCDEAQGYFLSRPIPAEAISRWLAQRDQFRLKAAV